jgi:hypothetical protein
MAVHIDYTSANWLLLADWARSRIEALRTSNDGDLDALQTARLRGQLKAFKEFLDLPNAAARDQATQPTGPFGLPPG